MTKAKKTAAKAPRDKGDDTRPAPKPDRRRLLREDPKPDSKVVFNDWASI